MADEPKNEEYESFRNDYEEIVKLNKILSNQGHPDKRKRDQTGTDLRIYANKIAKLTPGYNKSPEDMNGEEVKSALETGQEMAIERAGRNLEKIIDEQVPAENLEKLINSKEIAENASDKDRPALQDAAIYAGLKTIKESYEKTGKPRNEQEQEVLNRYGQIGAMEAQKEIYKEYSKDLQERGAAFAALAVRSGSISPEKMKEYVLKGIDKELKDYTEEKAVKAREAVRNTLKTLYKGNAKEAQTALSLVYQSGEKES